MFLQQQNNDDKTTTVQYEALEAFEGTCLRKQVVKYEHEDTTQ